MSVPEEMAKKLAQMFVGLDDIVLLREIAENGMEQAGDAGRSLVGATLVGGAMAARTAALGAQIGTKSAKAAADAMQGMIPGSEIAQQVVGEVDRRIGETGQQASRLAAHGAGIGRNGGSTPTNPLTGDAWLEKAIGEGEGWNTLLADSAVDFARLLAMPLTLGLGAGEAAAATPAGRTVSSYSWKAVSSLVDTLAGSSGEGSGDRAEARAAILALGLTPLASATQDAVDLSEGLTRLAFGDGRKLREALSKAIDRLDLGDRTTDNDPPAGDDMGLTEALRDRSKKASRHKPERVLAAGDAGDGIVSQYSSHAAALVEDGANLGSMTLIYSELLARVGINAAHAVLNGWRDVDAIEDWVGDDESELARDPDGPGTDRRRPVAVEQLEAVVSAVGPLEDDDASRGFFSRAALELAHDTVFSYTERAADRSRALERVERLFGSEARDKVGDDCSLRSEVRDADGYRDRLRILQDIAGELRREDLQCLIRARDHAAERLHSLERGENMLENMLTQRYAERVEALRSFVSIVDSSIALEGSPESQEPSRRRVFDRFEAVLDKLVQKPAA